VALTLQFYDKERALECFFPVRFLILRDGRAKRLFSAHLKGE